MQNSWGTRMALSMESATLQLGVVSTSATKMHISYKVEKIWYLTVSVYTFSVVGEILTHERGHLCDIQMWALQVQRTAVSPPQLGLLGGTL